jgi:hypothetical protein
MAIEDTNYIGADDNECRLQAEVSLSNAIALPREAEVDDSYGD